MYEYTARNAQYVEHETGSLLTIAVKNLSKIKLISPCNVLKLKTLKNDKNVLNNDPSAFSKCRPYFMIFLIIYCEHYIYELPRRSNDLQKKMRKLKPSRLLMAQSL